MLKFYNFIGQTPSGKTLSGVWPSQSEDNAIIELRALRLTIRDISLNFLKTLFGVFSSNDMNSADLARFYETMSSRIEASMSIIEGLEQAQDFLEDEVLITRVKLMHLLVSEGETFGNAMLASGFPEKDASAVAASKGARDSQILTMISEDIERDTQTRRSINSMMMMPIGISVFAYIVFFASLYGFMPIVKSMFAMSGKSQRRMPSFFKDLFAISDWAHANPILYVMVATLLFGVIFVFLRSNFVVNQINKIKIVRNPKERFAMAQSWNTMAMLYEANFNAFESIDRVGKMVTLNHAKPWFPQLYLKAKGGLEIADAIKMTDFPVYIQKGVFSAYNSGNAVQGLRRFTKMLYRDGDFMLDKLKAVVKSISYAWASLIVVLIAGITIFPIMLATSANL